MGLAAEFENDWFVELRLTASSFLSIADAARATIDDVGGQGITITWQVADLDDVRGRLLEQGVAVTEIKWKWGARVCYCWDPEGHRLELWAEKEGQIAEV